MNTTYCDAGILPVNASASAPEAKPYSEYWTDDAWFPRQASGALSDTSQSTTRVNTSQREWMWNCVSSPAAFDDPVKVCSAAPTNPNVTTGNLQAVVNTRDALVNVNSMCKVSQRQGWRAWCVDAHCSGCVEA